MTFLTKTLALLAVLILSDLHLGIMQTVAWATMVNDSIEMVSLTEKVAKTVSGEFPCERCLHLQEERNSSEEQTLDLVSKTQVFTPVAVANFRLSYRGAALFSVMPTYLRPDDPGSPVIEHPPRA